MLKAKTLHMLALLMMLNFRFAETIQIKIIQDKFEKHKRTWKTMLEHAEKIAKGNKNARKDKIGEKDDPKYSFLLLEGIIYIKEASKTTGANINKLIKKLRDIHIKKVRFINIPDEYPINEKYVRIINLDSPLKKIYDDTSSIDLSNAIQGKKGIDDETLESLKKGINFEKSITIDEKNFPKITYLERAKVSLELYIQDAKTIIAVFIIERPDNLLIL